MFEVFEEILPPDMLESVEALIDDIFMNPSNNFGLVLGNGLALNKLQPDGWWMQNQLTHYIDKSVPNLYNDLVDHLNTLIRPYGKEIDELYLTFLDRGQSIVWHNDSVSNEESINKNATGEDHKYPDPNDVVVRGFRINHDRRAGAITIYLNREWKWEWGGILKYGHQNWHDQYLPRFNTGVLFDNSLRHCVTKVESPGRDRSHENFRKTLQCWVRDV